MPTLSVVIMWCYMQVYAAGFMDMATDKIHASGRKCGCCKWSGQIWVLRGYVVLMQWGGLDCSPFLSHSFLHPFILSLPFSSSLRSSSPLFIPSFLLPSLHPFLPLPLSPSLPFFSSLSILSFPLSIPSFLPFLSPSLPFIHLSFFIPSWSFLPFFF